MAELSSADHGHSPPQVHVPRDYNAAHDLIERNLKAGRAAKIAFVDDRGAYSYGEVARRVDRFASALPTLGLRAEDRILLALLDSIDWVVAFLGAIKAGVIPVAVNTLLKPHDYEYMLRDSRARVLFVSQALMPSFEGVIDKVDTLARVVVSHAPAADPGGAGTFDTLLAAGSERCVPAATSSDEACFWLYSSGSTGMPKGTVHLHASLVQTAELYARAVLAIREDDVVFSAAKLFFAYGLGNGLTFPMAAGATAVLMAERPTPDSVFKRLTGEAPAALQTIASNPSQRSAGVTKVRPSIFYGVPTLFAAMLASPAFPDRSALSLRVSTSAGEALPEQVGTRFSEKTGVEILDGIGSTEMLHIFLSNQPGKVRYGTTGLPVPGYELKLLGDGGRPVARGEVGDLYIKGPSAAAMYWNQRDKTRATFQGEWTKSGDKYSCDDAGYYTYAGRSDDMLKVSGQYVSPFEVESAIASHPAVLEAAVVGAADSDQLIKPKAYVVLKEGGVANAELGDALKAHVKGRLAPFKYPRWIEFVAELPKTATGKIQRFKLRG